MLIVRQLFDAYSAVFVPDDQQRLLIRLGLEVIVATHTDTFEVIFVPEAPLYRSQ